MISAFWRVPLGARALLLSLFVGVCGCNSDPVGPQPGELGVLFIGNSLTYTNSLPEILEGLLELGGAGPVSIQAVVAPGVGLEDHWAGGSARDRIAAGGWDVVVLQQGPSATEGRPSLLEFSRLFAEEIRSVGARPALYMVWPAEVRSFDFDGVSDSYSSAAELVDGLLFPAGEAWRSAWARDPTVELYAGDRFHPSLLGSYLAALVMYEQLAKRDPRDLPPLIPTGSGDVPLSAEMASTLQEAAVEANAQHARPGG